MKNLPKKIDLRKNLKDVKIYDQGELGSSTACALATACEFEMTKKNKKTKFLYYKTKKI